MVEFGALSSVFDFVTFWVLLRGFHAGPPLFQTNWFTESLLTELVIALVVRTRRVCFRSRPGNTLLVSTLALLALALAIPYLPYVEMIGFVPLPPVLLLVLVVITAAYVVAAEGLKTWFYRQAP
jgi:Mg2+-importing ATPase